MAVSLPSSLARGWGSGGPFHCSWNAPGAGGQWAGLGLGRGGFLTLALRLPGGFRGSNPLLTLAPSCGRGLRLRGLQHQGRAGLWLWLSMNQTVPRGVCDQHSGHVPASATFLQGTGRVAGGAHCACLGSSLGPLRAGLSFEPSFNGLRTSRWKGPDQGPPDASEPRSTASLAPTAGGRCSESQNEGC